MLLKCERCGAPLDVPAGAAVRCSYCGAPASPPPPPLQRPGPPGHHNRAVRVQYPLVARRRSSLMSVLFGLIFLGAMLFVVAVNVLPQLARSSSPALQALTNMANQSHTLSLTSWSSAEPGCLIDANGDG